MCTYKIVYITGRFLQVGLFTFININTIFKIRAISIVGLYYCRSRTPLGGK